MVFRKKEKLISSPRLTKESTTLQWAKRWISDFFCFFLSCLVYLFNTIDTNVHGPKCRITFSLILLTPGMVLLGFFFFFFFFKDYMVQNPLKRSEIPETKINHFSVPLSNVNLVNSLVGQELDIRMFMFMFLFSFMFSVLAEYHCHQFSWSQVQNCILGRPANSRYLGLISLSNFSEKSRVPQNVIFFFIY